MTGAFILIMAFSNGSFLTVEFGNQQACLNASTQIVMETIKDGSIPTPRFSICVKKGR